MLGTHEETQLESQRRICPTSFLYSGPETGAVSDKALPGFLLCSFSF